MEAAEEGVTLSLEALHIPPEVHQRRLIRQGGEQRRLSPSELLGAPPKVAPRGGVEPHHIATKGRVRGVKG